MTAGATILLVDDEERMLDALQRTLRREGYQLLTATSGADALRVLERGAVDAILSDHKMPGQSGLDLLAQAATRCPRVVRILVSGWPEEVTPERLRALGIRALVAKPWDAHALRAILREALTGS